MENVIVLSFDRTDQAMEALRGLRRLHEDGSLELEAAAVVERTQEGEVVVVDLAEEPQLKGTAAGGVVGGLLGLLAGPLGGIAGAATGALVGSLVDIADVESTDQILTMLGDVISPGSTATIASLVEGSPAAVDRLASDLGVTVQRRPRAEVELQVAEVEESLIAVRREEGDQRTIADRLKDLRDAFSDRR